LFTCQTDIKESQANLIIVHRLIEPIV
jgi:hypothetical protein